MPEGDQGNKDELFEDLDKFFAPIQDVEWPEPEAPQAAPPATEPDDAEKAGESADEGHESEVSPESTLRIPEADPEAGALGAPASDAGAGDEDAPPDDILVRPAEESSTLPESSELFGRGDESEPAEGWAPEATAEEGWPGEHEIRDEAEAPEPVPADELESEGVSLGAVPEDAEPSIEDVEAAADHFAESVRAETGSEDDVAVMGDPVPATVTEPMQTVDLSSLEAEEDVSIAGEEDVEQSILADLDQPEVAQRTVVVGSGEGLGGPSWQEPTSVEVGGDQEGRPDTGRDVPAAFLTGLVLAAIALGSLAIGSGVFAVVASLIALVAMGELYGVMHRRHLQPATAVGLVGGALVLAGAYLHGEAAMAAMLAMTTAASFLWFMTVPQAHRKNITASIGVTILPVVYVALLAGYALTTVRLGALLDGPRLVIDVIVLTFAYDAVAFAVGSGWGSRPLAQTISPKKSWEGSAAATVVVVGVSVVMAALFVPVLDTIPRSVGLAIVVAVFAPLGDLAESLIKRDLDVKDMGSILPGHGGVLDRIDSLLFVAPAAFLYFRIFL